MADIAAIAERMDAQARAGSMARRPKDAPVEGLADLVEKKAQEMEQGVAKGRNAAFEDAMRDADLLSHMNQRLGIQAGIPGAAAPAPTPAAAAPAEPEKRGPGRPPNKKKKTEPEHVAGAAGAGFQERLKRLRLETQLQAYYEKFPAMREKFVPAPAALAKYSTGSLDEMVQLIELKLSMVDPQPMLDQAMPVVAGTLQKLAPYVAETAGLGADEVPLEGPVSLRLMLQSELKRDGAELKAAYDQLCIKYLGAFTMGPELQFVKALVQAVVVTAAVNRDARNSMMEQQQRGRAAPAAAPQQQQQKKEDVDAEIQAALKASQAVKQKEKEAKKAAPTTAKRGPGRPPKKKD